MSEKEEILIAADHAGVELKRKVQAELARRGYTVRDLGTDSAESTDYPDFAHPLAKAVSDGKAKRGVLLCGTGLGMSYVANRYPNVRAAVTWSPEVAELSRSHNDSNVLILPSRFVTEDDAEQILGRWLDTPFEGGRHERRVVKIDADAPRAGNAARQGTGSKGTVPKRERSAGTRTMKARKPVAARKKASGGRKAAKPKARRSPAAKRARGKKR